MAFTFSTGIYPIYFNSFVVPGADMVYTPDSEWWKLYPSHNKDYSKWALRSLIVVKEGSVVLFDTGFGNKQSDAFFDQFQLEGDYKLDQQLSEINLSKNDITDVVLTHLHYDHCGGCLLKEDGNIVATFPKAKLWISSSQWENAMNPSKEEKESFLDENIKPLTNFYPIQFVEEGTYLPGIYFKIANGHTKGQIIPLINMEGGNLLFGADLFPSSAHLDPEVNMIYDIDQVQAAKEKKIVLEECIRNKYIIAFQHDMFTEACTVTRESGKTVLNPVKLDSI